MSPLRLPWRRAAGPPGGLACQELVEHVTDYLEGALTARDRRRFETHISVCEGCAAYDEQLRQTLSVLGRIEPEDLSPEAEQELLDAFRHWRSEEQPDGPS